MKKRLFAFISIISVAIILTACGTAKTDGGGNGSMETYTVATDASFKPFEYKDESGEMKGFDIDLMKAIAEEAGFKVKFESMEFDGLIAGMQSGRYPMAIAGISITEERKETIDFSDPYYDSGLILMVPKGSDIKSIDDVSGKKIGTKQGTTSQNYLLENTKAEVEAYPEIVNAYMDVQSGRLDAALYDLPNVLFYIKENGEGELETAGDVFEGQPYGIAFKKGSDLVDDVNEALATLKENGTYAEIYKEYFGTEPPQ